MDPNANLGEQEQIVSAWAYRSVSAGTPPAHERARLHELRSALGGWLASGGFEPVWTAAPRASAWWAAQGLIKGRRVPAARCDETAHYRAE